MIKAVQYCSRVQSAVHSVVDHLVCWQYKLSYTRTHHGWDHFRSADLQLSYDGKHVHLGVLLYLLYGVIHGTEHTATHGTVPTTTKQCNGSGTHIVVLISSFLIPRVKNY